MELHSYRQIEPADFRKIKTEYTVKLEKSETKLGDSNHDKVDLKTCLIKGSTTS